MSTEHPGTPPLADYDQLPAGAVESRIRGLDADQLRDLLAYERAHADRAPVVQLLMARLDQLDRGATPSPGGDGSHPERPAPRRSGSPVSPSTAAAPTHPPPHGTQDQPGKPKGDRP